MKQWLSAIVLGAVGFLATKLVHLDLQVADGVTVNNEFLVWVNGVLASIGGWWGGSKLPDLKLPKLGGTAAPSFMNAVDAHRTLEDFLTVGREPADSENVEKALKAVWLEIRYACKDCKVKEPTK